MLDNIKKIFRQDLNKKQENPGAMFMITLLSEENCDFPPQESTEASLEKHLGKINIQKYGSELIAFAPQEYFIENNGKSIPPLLSVFQCTASGNDDIDDLTRSQMWDCPEREEILDKCRFRITACDMMGGMMNTDYKRRAEMLVKFTDALLEMFPQCRAVYFKSSGKLLTPDNFADKSIPEKYRFVCHAVNVRFFNIQNTEDMMVDTLGMGILGLPDLQYHFHGLEPNDVVLHAKNVLAYIYDNDCPIESGHTIDGVKDASGKCEKWRCQFENSLIQPVREVIDIEAGEYASGQRRR